MNKNVETANSRPFPWKCARCGKRTVEPEETDYTTEIVHDGRPYQVAVQGLRTPRCQNPECREILLDTEANRRVTQTFRRVANLLEPDEIRRRREELGLTQAALAERLEVGSATVSRWETGAQIQQRSLDKLLRLFFDLPEVRRALEPPKRGKFRRLKPTDEQRRRAQLFRLMDSNGSTEGLDLAEDAEKTAEAIAASRTDA